MRQNIQLNKKEIRRIVNDRSAIGLEAEGAREVVDVPYLRWGEKCTAPNVKTYVSTLFFWKLHGGLNGRGSSLR
jgi:hypothetical protein